MENSLVEDFVFICSPYRPESLDPEDRAAELRGNIAFAKAACMEAIHEGYVPMAPHLYFTQFLDDDNEEQREAGIEMGFAWIEDCMELWVIGDRITEGMAAEIAKATEMNIPVRIKRFDGANGKEGKG